MATRAWLVRCGGAVVFAGATLLLGACTRPGSGGTETPTAPPPTARASVTVARTVTRVAPSIAPSAIAPSVPSAAPSAAPVVPSPAPSAAPAPSGQKYVVQSGDTLSGIADQFGVTIQQLIDANSLQNPDLLLPGQELIIPGR